ncbi:MAG: ZIP family metal transporter [Candidatus Tectomicrobia bacterium]|nr:ZIP family metal transporter [Candidatus Tectomicrobia bacterium]
MAAGEMKESLKGERGAGAPLKMVSLFLFPLVLLGALVYHVMTGGEAILGRPPVSQDALQKLEFQRVVLRPSQIALSLINTGPGPVSVGQVTVNEALWRFSAEPAGPIPRLGRATIRIPYPWHAEEPLKVAVISSAGMKFEKTIAVAAETPEMGLSAIGYFSLIGIYVGVIPVFLGLLWRPFLQRIGGGAMSFLVSFTVGVLLALGVDVLVEAVEAAGRVGSALRGGSVVTLGLMGGLLFLAGVEHSIPRASAPRGGEVLRERLILAYLISVGIGLHNFGEGVAIGSAYAVGKVALGALLIVGFMVHNVTEGIAIVAPITQGRIGWRHFAAMGLLAGAPTVAGTILGGFAYYDTFAALFFAVSGGAIFYVIYQIGRDVSRGRGQPFTSWQEAAGLLTGVALMYATGLLVAA